MDTVVTPEMMVAAITEAGYVAEGSEAPVGLAGTPAIGETDGAESPSTETQVAPTKGNAIGEPAEGKTEAAEGASAEEVEVAEVS